MTEVITVEMAEESGRYWLVAVGSEGTSRVLARCDMEEQAEIVANAVRSLPLEKQADVMERLAVLAKRRSVARAWRAMTQVPS